MININYLVIIFAAVGWLVMPYQSNDNLVEDDIVVIGRKMRLVKLTYNMQGPYVKNCDISVSSGEARIDRIVCAMVKACVREGHREVLEATECVKNKIEQFSNDKSMEEKFGIDQSANISQEYNQKGDEDKEIVVVGALQPKPGLWRFSAMATVQGKIMPPKNWEKCIWNDDIDTTIEQIFGKKVVYDISGVCSLKRLSVDNGTIEGLRQCMSSSGRTRTEISGRYNSVEISFSERTEISRSGRSSDGSGGDLFTLTRGRHIGTCKK